MVQDFHRRLEIVNIPFWVSQNTIMELTLLHQLVLLLWLLGMELLSKLDGVGTEGNCVRIRHNSSYTTGYGHLSKFATKTGRRVRQGQIIGYVGNTGMSTGPHLHYTVKYNGKFINSQKLKLPSGKILKGEERKLFEVERIKLDVKLAELKSFKR